MYETLLVEKKDMVGTITFNRPDKMNCVTRQLQLDLIHALDDLETDDNIRVAILTGAGKCFCAGFDLNLIYSTIEWLAKMDDVVRLLSFEKPIIAALNGPAIAQGFQFVIGCDIVIASEKASLAISGAATGLFATCGIFNLTAAVGRNRASELLYTAEPIGPDEALRIGLVNKVVPPDQLMPAAYEMADRIKKNAPLSLKYTKKAMIRTKLHTELDGNTIEWVREALGRLDTTEDRKEGFKAIMERRKPVFKGK